MHRDADVIVIGGGHAGSEAAALAARMGARVLLVTSSLESIGQMSCNPAIGGVAKGTVVREVDALGGVMGRATDRATIQFRMLNRSKGPAVWAPRAQCDRALYRAAVRHELERFERLSMLQATVHRLLLDGDRVIGVATHDGRTLRAPSVVLTAGTFLRGRIHVGTDTRIPAGRAGDPPAIELAEQLEALGLRVARFKTGTPPRVDGRTVDYARTERQDGESPEYRFSALARHDRAGERPCWITWAAAPVTDIIREHLHSSALYGGEISGRGPRYCPSIEDKVVKFPNAERHQIFLEPEGLGTEELYVNGLSTSLPVDVQEQFLRAVPGLEQVRMTRAGYAIEYDYYPPEQLTPWLAVKALDGLFFAGQINGTTGYEEAAGQGALAGMNAARHAFEQEPIVIGRDEAYIGVLVDDLVTRGVDEPYRLFTSRAEHRLLLRQDNAVKRLMHLADRLDLWTSEETALVDRRIAGEREIIEVASTTTASLAANAVLIGVNEREITEPTRVIDLVRRPRVPLRALLEHLGHAPEAPSEAWISSEIEIKYAGYLERERVAARRLAEMAEFVLPQALPWDELTSLSYEAREKLSRVQPVSLAQAGRIPGVSPSDLQNLVVEVLRRRRVA